MEKTMPLAEISTTTYYVNGTIFAVNSLLLITEAACSMQKINITEYYSRSRAACGRKGVIFPCVLRVIREMSGDGFAADCMPRHLTNIKAAKFSK